VKKLGRKWMSSAGPSALIWWPERTLQFQGARQQAASETRRKQACALQKACGTDAQRHASQRVTVNQGIPDFFTPSAARENELRLTWTRREFII